MINAIYQRVFPTILIDDHYVLREQHLDDSEAFFKYYSDPEVHRFILATPPTSLSEASSEIHYCRNLFYHKRGIYWSLARRDNNEIIGAVGLYINNHHHRAEICYDLSKSYWRQGIMSRTLKKVLDYAFLETEIHRIEAIVLKENDASITLLKKLGFVHEGSLRKYRYFNDKPHDIELFAITLELYNQNFTTETINI